ncbi:serine/threonine protein kinase, putative [Perkinsus marinus ATCC 50983]|uniref:Serine/threonine protein kinase, putative n=1 Tax=Perkinsus marinus (strain ATCC 50983 / TXsc) TaxID=423536 RepID=C5KHA2_PERM5|nr:serine/threonine protein kinase, putative [Perkinsus marinus ATCC 50983]EER15964.1 serine/threonine protein kinase, putative [Perkinsus marinus ATCC 50983]|eukprot:XP_002784168.1 serine/threonine protein kinase, putative [Perkinsus marinus ATCC 50983]
MPVDGISSPICFKGSESFDFIRSIHSGRKSRVWVAKIEEDVGGLAGQLCVVKMINTAEFRSREQIQHILDERKAAYMAGQNSDLQGRCCALLGTYKTPDQVCLVLTAMKGDPIHHHFQRAAGGHFTEYRAKYYTYYIASTLRILHREGYVYRDLKASNVLLVEGRPVLIDFGMCKKIAETGGRTYSVCGTYHAMAPEVRALSGIDHDARVATTSGYGYAVDFWALGILLIEMLTGKPPFGYRDGDIGDLFDLSRGSPSTIHWASGFHPSRELIDLVEKLLQPDPSQRLTDWDATLSHPYFTGITDDMPPPEWDHDLGADLWDTDVSDESFTSSSVDVFRDF